MRTRNYKSLNGWLRVLTMNHPRANGNEVYEPLDFFFCSTGQHVYYYTDFGTPNEKYHSYIAQIPWEQKLPIARRIVDFHWSSRTKSDRERIAVALAQGEGDLSYLNSFQLELRKNGSKWEYQYCTSGLSGPNYDYCKRKYLQSI